MLHYKLPVGCLMLVLLIIFVYYYDKHRRNVKERAMWFELLLFSSVLYFCLDIATVYTVNHLDSVSPIVNKLLHLLYLSMIDWCILDVFLYLFALLGIYYSPRQRRWLVYMPFGAGILGMLLSINSLEYRIGNETNYSMGVSVYICYVLVTYYFVLACVSWLRNRKYLPKGKQATFLLCIPVFMGFMVFQAFFPESLVTSLGITLLILGAYCSSENAANVELLQYHNKVVLAFAEVIESRDGSTGQHVKRTTAYVRIIAEELERRKAFPEVLSKDYLQSMLKAAPLHDFGKIAVPDAILQKPGRLTQEEYEIMKQHTVKGSDMIENTLSALEEPEDIRIAYQVARYHHERWDGGGYPEGLAGERIPLCARVMAVADVFDAVSQKRCYREAMSLEQSFAIIAEGVGSQFDPAIAEAFLQKREEVEEIYYSFFN